MKKRMLVFFALALFLSACGKGKTPLGQYSWEQVSDYAIVAENDDGSVIVTLTAPDYAQLIQTMLSADCNAKISEQSLAEAIEMYPDCVKVYTISADTSEEGAIQAAFSDQIAKELAVALIGRAESAEEWGDGQ